MIKKLLNAWVVYAGVTGYFYMISDNTKNVFDSLHTEMGSGKGTGTKYEIVFMWKIIIDNFKEAFRLLKELP